MSILFEILAVIIIVLMTLGSILISWGVQQEKIKRRKKGDWMWPYIVTPKNNNETKQ